MKEKRIVKMLESIPKFGTYSQYNSNLEKIFRSNNLKYLIEKLKSQKDIGEFSLLDKISKINTDEPIDIYADEDSELKKIQKEEEHDIFDEINEEKEIPPIKKKEKKIFFNYELVRKKKLMPPLDPFKYNPNYDSIYKKIRSFKIIDPKKTLNSLDKKYKRKHKYKSTDIYNNKKHSNKRFITDSNIFSNNNSILKNYDINKTHSKKTISLNTINNINNNENGKLPKLIKLSKANNNESINLDNENHALRFSKYIPRKYNVPENNENISYINPINYIKPKNKTKSIDFDKMINRKEKDLLYASCLKNPSFAQYNPKYTYIDKNETVKLFNPKKINYNKKYLMRKLWTSYEVPTEYQLVDNNKINK